MSELVEFEGFPKIHRLSRNVVITEKIDGTNAQVCITEDGQFLTGSRNRWITPENDNCGFSRWSHENKEELLKLGPGRHFGEWYGSGIQRRYGLDEKRFSLFDSLRWNSDNIPKCCHIVPILYNDIWIAGIEERCIEFLRTFGSVAVPGFSDPEGIVIFHVAGRCLFKKTLKNDEKAKGQKE